MLPGSAFQKLASVIWFSISFGNLQISTAQTYEVAEIDCAVGQGGKELMTARLRKPNGFRGTPIFADDRGSSSLHDPSIPSAIFQHIDPDSPCQIYPDPLDTTERVYILKVMDFTKCGVLKRDGFINVRVWFPQLPGVVMLSDQEVIIMCKPPQPTILQSKAAGFAGSIPKGPRVTGVVEEHPGQLEYEVALFRETAATGTGRAVASTGAYVTGMDSQELGPVDQAVPIGTRLQLRAKISSTSAWQHAKLLDVSVSPDPKNPAAEGAVALVKNGCRNPDLASIIPKQPYRSKETRTNEVVLDFEAFLLSNMGDRSTLWLHTQIKACMEALDCESEVCIMDVYQPASYGRRRRRGADMPAVSAVFGTNTHNQTVAGYSSPLLKHWKTIVGPAEAETENLIETVKRGPPIPKEPKLKSNPKQSSKGKNGTNTNFGDNIGFSVIMPPDYYRSDPSWNPITTSSSSECRGWILASLLSLLGAVITGVACVVNYRMKRSKLKEEALYSYDRPITPNPAFSTSVDKNWSRKSDEFSDPISTGASSASKLSRSSNRQHTSSKYARDPSMYRS